MLTAALSALFIIKLIFSLPVFLQFMYNSKYTFYLFYLYLFFHKVLADIDVSYVELIFTDSVFHSFKSFSRTKIKLFTKNCMFISFKMYFTVFLSLHKFKS